MIGRRVFPTADKISSSEKKESAAFRVEATTYSKAPLLFVERGGGGGIGGNFS